MHEDGIADDDAFILDPMAFSSIESIVDMQGYYDDFINATISNPSTSTTSH